MENGDQFRNNWNKFFRNGKTVILPIDHGTAIPVKGLESPTELIETVYPYVNGFVVNFGLARSFSDSLEGKGICFRTDIYKPPHEDNDDHGSYRVFTAEDGLSIGANAVMNMCYTHHPKEETIYRECAGLVSECIDSELPVILESLPFGIGRSDDYTVENISFAVKCAAEIGADVVKTAYPTGSSIEEFREIIDSSYVPVIVLGGAAMGDDNALFTMARNAMDSGASGIAIGRNVWQHDKPAAVARSLASIVHDDTSASSAIKLMSDPL